MILFIIGIIVGIAGTLYVVPTDRIYKQKIRDLEELHAKETAHLRMQNWQLSQRRKVG